MILVISRETPKCNPLGYLTFAAMYTKKIIYPMSYIRPYKEPLLIKYVSIF
jgi:hypothetical protein